MDRDRLEAVELALVRLDVSDESGWLSVALAGGEGGQRGCVEVRELGPDIVLDADRQVRGQFAVDELGRVGDSVI